MKISNIKINVSVDSDKYISKLSDVVIAIANLNKLIDDLNETEIEVKID